MGEEPRRSLKSGSPPQAGNNQVPEKHPGSADGGGALRRWHPGDRESAYAELDHPADILLEVYGKDLPELFENALFALYDQVAELEGFEAKQNQMIEVEGPSPAEALRALLSEALYRFDTQAYVASQAKIEVESAAGRVVVRAKLAGETVQRQRHVLLDEVKAVTYHQLSVDKVPEGGWRATVLFDV